MILKAIQALKQFLYWNFTGSYRNHKTDTMKLIYASFFTAESKLFPIPSLYLEKIRIMRMTAFFSQMPKSDLHHHFSGSIYAEPILEDAIINFTSIPTTVEVLKKPGLR
jgi:adenosine deaminase/adenosine deaminase CECR1